MSDIPRGPRMWGGRFVEPPDPRILEFTSSFAVDRRLFRWDLLGSIAHAQMLGATGIIPSADAGAIVDGLRALAAEVDAGRLAVDGPYEDVHSFIEAQLYQRIGPVAGRLHTARSRNDQVVTAFRLFAKEAAVRLGRAVGDLMAHTVARAGESIDTILPAFTHLQHAQPVRLAHHLLTYVWMLDRDAGRFRDCYRRADVLPLGSGAAAGVSFPIDRRSVADVLGFARVSENSIDATGDRDFAVDLVYAATMLMVHLSRWAGEIVLWATDEFGFVTLSDAVAHGSSIMPQKKNPDTAELIRGRAGRTIGTLSGLLAVLKGVACGYGSDLQEDKSLTFDAVDTAAASARTMLILLQGTRFEPAQMQAAASRGLLTATEVADYLARKGVPFREAHAVAGKVVQAAVARGRQIYDLPLASFRDISPLFDADVIEAATIEASVEAKGVPGGTARDAVLAQLKAASSRLEALEEWIAGTSASMKRVATLLKGNDG